MDPDAEKGQLVPYMHQVAGHPGSVLISGSGKYILKPSLPVEISFYDKLAPLYFKELIQHGYIPAYFGIVRNDAVPLKGPKTALVREGMYTSTIKADSTVDQAIKLENLTQSFVRPNVLDIKLGTQLFDPLDERLTQEKQARMERESACTTSGSDGIRLTGFMARLSPPAFRFPLIHRCFRSTTGQQGSMRPLAKNTVNPLFPKNCHKVYGAFFQTFTRTLLFIPSPNGLLLLRSDPPVRISCYALVAFWIMLRPSTELYQGTNGGYMGEACW